jgi:hypothetical protein
MIMNPLHASIPNPRILKVTSDAAWKTDGTKRWTQGECTVLAKVEVPAVSLEEKVAFAICVAPHPSTREFAVKWLTGEDRSYGSAWAAVDAAEVMDAAAWAAAWSATAAAEVREFAAATGEATATATAAEAAAKGAEGDQERFEARLPLVLERAEAILAGEYPAEQYDAPYEERKER